MSEIFDGIHSLPYAVAYTQFQQDYFGLPEDAFRWFFLSSYFENAWSKVQIKMVVCLFSLLLADPLL
jgi:hypothetical protein